MAPVWVWSVFYFAFMPRLLSRLTALAFGRDPESKRQMSGFLATVGVLLVGLDITTMNAVPEVFSEVGAAILFLSWLAARSAASQERFEGRARDLIEWKREEQELRRVFGSLWRRLERGYRIFQSINGLDQPFDDLIANSGWPDRRPGPTKEQLEAYFRECLPPDGYNSVLRASTRTRLRQALGRYNRNLISDWEEAKDLLEVWSIALDAGGSRATALREVINGLKTKHEDSIRLMWYLSRAHTAHVDVADEPDYSFVRRVRDVMESRQ